jgi:hypothetical protein
VRTILALTAGAAIATIVVLALADGVVEIVAFELIVVALVAAAFLAVGPLRPARILERAPLRRSASQLDHPPQLQRLEWMVDFGTTASADAELRLIPELRSVAAERLTERHQVDITEDREAASALLGPVAWPFLDPARPRRFGRSSLSPTQVAEIVTAIEAL